MKKTILVILLILFAMSGISFANSFVLADNDSFSTEDLSGKGGSSRSYRRDDYVSGRGDNRSKTSGDGGYNYDDYMDTSSPTESRKASRYNSGYSRTREPSSYNFEFEANFNPSVVEGRLAAFIPLNMSSLGAAVGILYDKDNFSIGNADLTMGNRQSGDIFRFDIGFRGLAGSAEKRDSIDNGDMKALAFLASAAYSIQGGEVFYQMPINFEIAGELSFAPEPLCFGDGEQYMETKITFGIDIFGDGRGFLILGGRYINVRLNKNSENWDASDGSVFAGFKLRF